MCGLLWLLAALLASCIGQSPEAQSGSSAWQISNTQINVVTSSVSVTCDQNRIVFRGTDSAGSETMYSLLLNILRAWPDSLGSVPSGVTVDSFLPTANSQWVLYVFNGTSLYSVAIDGGSSPVLLSSAAASSLSGAQVQLASSNLSPVPQATPLPSCGCVYSPFSTPNGATVIFVEDGRLIATSPSGGPRSVASLASQADVSLLCSGNTGALYTSQAAGGLFFARISSPPPSEKWSYSVAMIVPSDDTNPPLVSSVILSNNERYAFWIQGGSLYAANLTDVAPVAVMVSDGVSQVSSFQVSPSGTSVIYASDVGLFLQNLPVSDTVVPLALSPIASPGDGISDFVVSWSQALVVYSGQFAVFNDAFNVSGVQVYAISLTSASSLSSTTLGDVVNVTAVVSANATSDGSTVSIGLQISCNGAFALFSTNSAVVDNTTVPVVQVYSVPLSRTIAPAAISVVNISPNATDNPNAITWPVFLSWDSSFAMYVSQLPDTTAPLGLFSVSLSGGVTVQTNLPLTDPSQTISDVIPMQPKIVFWVSDVFAPAFSILQNKALAALLRVSWLMWIGILLSFTVLQ